MNNITKLLIVLSVGMMSVFFTGCASITRGTTEPVKFESVPPGAKVTLSNGFTGRTPVTFTLKRKSKVSAKFELEGYEPVTIDLKGTLAGKGAAGFVGNAIFGGAIGGVVDIASGATLSISPNPVVVDFLVIEKPIESEILEEIEGEALEDNETVEITNSNEQPVENVES